MRIESNKNNNINEESKTALKQFHKKQILDNIKYHKIFIFFMILINIGLFSFIILYKIKISEIKRRATTYSSSIYSKDKEISSRYISIDHKMVNIASLSGGDHYRFSIIFDKKDEFSKIKDIVYEYIQETDINNREIIFLYQSIIDSDSYEDFMIRIIYFPNIFIFVQTEKGYKFGIFLKDIIIPNKNNEFIAESKDIFLYSFETKKLYNFSGNKKKSLSFTKGKILILGDDELIIYNEYWTKGGFINYPLKSFDLSDNNKNVLTGQNGEFYIRYIEVYSF